MKVIRIVSELDFGGVEKVIANSVPVLVRDGHIDVSIIVLGLGGRISQELLQKGIPVIVLNQNPRIPNIGLIFRLRKMLLDSKADVLHCQGGEANFHGILAGHLAGVKKIIGEEVGIPNHHSYWKYIFRQVYLKAHVIIAISQAVKDNIVGLGEVGEEMVKVVYNPIDLVKVGLGGKEFNGGFENTEDFEVPGRFGASFRSTPNEMECRQNDKVRPFVFVTTCRLVPIKNLDRLISAFSELLKEFNERPMELWIVGDGPLKEVLVKQVNELGILEMVKFCGFQEHVVPYLIRADVFVLPSLREGSSVSLAEAMACGLPSVVTKVGGTSEVLGQSLSGILIDPLNTNSITTGLADMITLGDSERNEMGKRAMNEAKRFSPENYMNLILTIYKV